jgi:two-component system phosphate regulon sensor histidine kinase PhoR
LICVRDTGEGLLPDQTDRVFERFYRVDRARSREIGGTGLGLAIVKHLARLHGGEVSVDSKLGEGTAFTIELPSLTDKG